MEVEAPFLGGLPRIGRINWPSFILNMNTDLPLIATMVAAILATLGRACFYTTFDSEAGFFTRLAGLVSL